MSPIRFTDLFGQTHVEPSVTGLVHIQTIEQVPGSLVNRLFLLSQFRSGQPKTVHRFTSLSALASYHDPQSTGDEGVAIARATRGVFADDNVFGAPEINTVRVDPATPAGVGLYAGAVKLLGIRTSDHGAHTNNRKAIVEPGTQVGKRITLLNLDDQRDRYVGDNLGVLMSIEYSGNAAVALLRVRQASASIYYAGQPTDGDQVVVNGVVFEFDNDSSITGDVPVTIAPTASDTWKAFADAVRVQVDALDDVIHDAERVTITATEAGVVAEERVDAGSVYSVIHEHPAARLQVWLGGEISYTGQPQDGDTITVNGMVFEFESAGGVATGHIAVNIGATADITYANFAAVLRSTIPLFRVIHDTTANTVRVLATSVAVSIAENATNASATTGPTDGTLGLDLPLTLPAYRSLQTLAAFIDSQQGYAASVNQFANKFLPSTGIDPAEDVDVSTVTSITGYVAAIADWVNTRTRGAYKATEHRRSIPDNASYLFSGGTSPVTTLADWTQALDVTAEATEEGGILLLNTDDPAVMAMTVTFIDEQRAKGRWYRAFFGMQPALAIGNDVSEYLRRASAIDHHRVRLYCQRPGVLNSDGSVKWLHPVFLAAAFAGAAAGTLPYKQPLTNRRLRFVGVHPDDEFNEVTRESLLEGGITVLKRELGTLRVALAVTASLDPNKRMLRIMSEIDTVDLMDARVRAAFLAFRGKWANANVAARVAGVLQRVLNAFAQDGAITAGVDESGNFVPAWVGKPLDDQGNNFIIYAGKLSVGWQAFIPGELNHVSIEGSVEYQRLVGSVGGAVADQVTVVPIR